MCTSTARSPRDANAAAISSWLLTPCSRSIGDARAGADARERSGHVLAPDRSSAATKSPGSSGSSRARALLGGALRVVAQRLHAETGLRPGRPQGRARRRQDRPPAATELDPLIVDHATEDGRAAVETRLRQNSRARCRSRRCNLQHRAQLLANRALLRRFRRRPAASPRGRIGRRTPSRTSVTNRPPSERS